MERHYYGLKALLVTVAIVCAMAWNGYGVPRVDSLMTQTHYRAAISVEMAFRQTSNNIARSLAELLSDPRRSH